MPHTVRTHTRRTASGKTVTVHQHQRQGGTVSPGHAREMGRKAVRYGQRHKKGRAALFGLLAAGEITLWLTIGGTVLLLAAAAGTLGFLCSLLGAFSGTQQRKQARPEHDYWADDEACMHGVPSPCGICDAPKSEPRPRPKVNRARRPPAASKTHDWPEEDSGKYLLTVRSRSGRRVNMVTGASSDTVVVHSRADLDQRLAAAKADPDYDVSYEPAS